MTIDEAITKYKEITNTDAICPGHCNISCDKCVHDSEQIAEWLEELKELRVTSFGYSKEDIELNRTAMYFKAIDEFSEELKDYFVIPHDVIIIDIIAEHLKAENRKEKKE